MGYLERLVGHYGEVKVGGGAIWTGQGEVGKLLTLNFIYDKNENTL